MAMPAAAHQMRLCPLFHPIGALQELCLEANVLQPARPRRPLLRLLRLGVRTGLTVAATLVVAQHADLIRDEIQKFG